MKKEYENTQYNYKTKVLLKNIYEKAKKERMSE